MQTKEPTRTARREALGLNQAELAVRIGVSPSTLYRWEAGISEPIDALAKLWEGWLNRLEAQQARKEGK